MPRLGTPSTRSQRPSPLAPRLLCVALGLIGLTSSAQAANRLAAMLPSLKPAGSTELRDRFHDAASRGLVGSGLEVVGGADVRTRLGGAADQLSCTGPGACAAKVAQTLSADHLVATEVTVQGKDYSFKLSIIDSSGREEAKLDDTCEICTVKEADQSLVRAIAKLLANNRTLITAPRVSVAATPVAVAPAKRPPSAPPSKLAIDESSDYPPSMAPTPAAPAAAPSAKSQPPTPAAPAAAAPIAAVPDSRSPAGTSQVPWRVIAFTTLAVGVVGIVSGAPLLAIDGRPTCDKPNPITTCPEVYNTVAGGASLVALGVAGLATAGVSFYLDHRQRSAAKSPSARLLPSFAPLAGRDGAGGLLALSGRF
jgi:hypothetical protein